VFFLIFIILVQFPDESLLIHPASNKKPVSRFDEADLVFKFTEIRSRLNRLASDLLLTIQEDRFAKIALSTIDCFIHYYHVFSDSIIFMSREEELSSQVLVFTDEGLHNKKKSEKFNLIQN
jgi:hypothetical protein